MINQLNSNTKQRNFKYLTSFEGGGEIYALLSEGHSISNIAKKINCSRNTIYNEIKRGSVQQIKQNRKVIIYFPERG